MAFVISGPLSNRMSEASGLQMEPTHRKAPEKRNLEEGGMRWGHQNFEDIPYDEQRGHD
jgi:hypothetical protein